MSADHWRKQGERYNLLGEKRELEDGTFQVKLIGSNTWNKLQQNGHRKDEDPFRRPVIYQAPRPGSENGKGPKKIRGSVVISASAG